jgi:hypothetical protein
MQSTQETAAVSPPKLFSSIAAGFNTVASHIYLILFPVAVDLLLWFGPHLKVKELLQPFVIQFLAALQEMSAPGDPTGIVQYGQEIWETFLTRFNLVSLVRTYPIGVTSLFSGALPIETPMGMARQIELTSFLAVLGLWLLLVITGLAAGSLFMGEIARCSTEEKPAFSAKKSAWQFSQVVLFTITLIVLLILIAMPATLMLSVLMMFSPTLAQISLFMMSMLALWLLLPLVFAPHGMFSFGYNAFTATRTSINLVRFFLPGTGMFLLTVLLISQGLDIVWRMADETSWMAMIGLLGHAFVSTSLLSASFIYYLGGVRWMQESLRKLSLKRA